MSMDWLFDIVPLSCSDQEQNKSSSRQIRMVRCIVDTSLKLALVEIFDPFKGVKIH